MKEKTENDALIGGTEHRDIEIVGYNPIWQKTFLEHANHIAGVLGDAALRIEHIGSTSVPGLAAKAIIDILLVVEDSGDEASYLSEMEAGGYVLRVREPDFHEHRMFRTPERDVHIHVFSHSTEEIERVVTFRDRLRRNSDERRRYENTKRKLAAQSRPNMNDYANAKTEVIEDIIAAARAAGEVSL